MARMTPVLGATPLWTTAVTVAGAATMVVGAYRSVQETDLKRILAYSTISALGLLMMLLGIGTREAIAAALVYLVAHACYKGALFLVAGAIDHETGSRDITALAGLRRAMPITAVAGGAAAAVDGRRAADARLCQQGGRIRGVAAWRRLADRGCWSSPCSRAFSSEWPGCSLACCPFAARPRATRCTNPRGRSGCRPSRWRSRAWSPASSRGSSTHRSRGRRRRS